MTPQKMGKVTDEKFPSGGGPPLYAKKMKALPEIIADHIGANVNTVIWTYKRLDYRNPDEYALKDTTHRGMALFQYDPRGHNGGKAWRLYYENICYHSSTPGNRC
jgi:hypothetical protein